MSPEPYKGYVIWGHAVPEGGRFIANGTVTRGQALVEASGKLGLFWTDDEARAAGMEWARAWVDQRG
jgi:hypothetical protein